MEKLNYRIGLDIGISSIGWCVIENDLESKPTKIVDLGVRIFSPAEINDNGKNKPLALDRRIARGTRRRLRRMKYRVDSMSNFLCQRFDFGVDKYGLNNYIEQKRFNVYELRHKALFEKLDDAEIAKILLYFVKHRGYKTTSSSQDSEDKEQSKMKSALQGNKQIIEKYLTVGEYLYQNRVEREYISNGVKKVEEIYNTRNRQGEYTKCIYRSMLEQEIKTILTKQQEFGNAKIDDSFVIQALEIFNRQLNFDQGPNEPSPYHGLYKVGYCQFYPEEKRAPKGAFTFEYFSALQKINQLAVIDQDGKHFITNEQKQVLLENLLSKGEITYKNIRKLLCLDENVKFNGLTYAAPKKEAKTKKSPEDAKLFELKNTKKIAKALQMDKITKRDALLLDQIAEILSYYKSDDNRLAQLDASEITNNLTQEQKNNLLSINLSQFGNLSIKAMQKIIEPLEEGYLYSEAVEKAGFNFSRISNDEQKSTKIIFDERLKNYMADITNPVVKRALGQVIKVVNAIINKYGSPQTLHIELARDIKKSIVERRTIENNQKIRFENNKKAEEELLKINIQPTSKNLLIYKLYLEQGGKSPYSSTPILESCGVNNCDLRYLFNENYAQVDHIIPYSKSFDDSWNNKVLVLAKENQNKGDRTPLEWLKGDRDKVQAFVDFVATTYSHNANKKEHLLTKLTDENLINEWRTASLNDTRTIAVYTKDLFEQFLLFAQSKYKRKVYCVNGQVTSYLGKIWGIEKIRSKNDRHHARDAVIVAVTDNNMLQEITHFFKYKYYNDNYGVERRVNAMGNIEYIIKKTGEIMSEEEYDKYMTKYVIQPYTNFRKELIARLSDNPCNPEFDIHDCYAQYSNEEIKSLKPIFISQMPNRKANGELHDATIYGVSNEKHKSGNLILTKRVEITQLKLTKDKQDIQDYYERAKNEDKATYNVLLKRLQEFDGDAKEAFAQPIYKPIKDGSVGNPIKKVKIQKVSSNTTKIENRGMAMGGDMLRIDIFSKNKKYYAVPVYIRDLYSGKLPTKVCKAATSEEDWDDISNGYNFEFSLYSGDLFYLEIKKGINGTVKETGEKTLTTEGGLYYYTGFNRAISTISFKNNDNSVEYSVGFKSANKFEKYVVDILGEYHKVGKCKREELKFKRG